jgi:hypothetical protein
VVTTVILNSLGGLFGGAPTGWLDLLLAVKAIGLIALFILQHHPHRATGAGRQADRVWAN